MQKLLSAGLLLILFSCSPDTGYRIQGTIDSDFAGTVYLYKPIGYSLEKLDSTQVKKHAFVFAGQIEVPDIYLISFEGSDKKHQLILENKRIDLTFITPEDLAGFSGSMLQVDMVMFKQEMGKLESEERNLITSIWRDSTTTEPQKDSLYVILKQVREKKIDLANKYISDHPDSPHTPDVLNIYIRNFLKIDQLDSVFQTFTMDVQQSNRGSMLGKSIEGVRRSAVGNPMIDFTMPGMNGEEVRLSDLVKSNKLLFIDFWASWCGPCRSSIPELKKIYADYHDQGLEFLAVSYDDDREKWLTAIEEEQLIWPNASNLKGWDCPTVLAYAIRGIPASVMINQDGLIVARNLRGEKLRHKIEELLAD